MEGHALAEVLFGDYSPAGRLTQTWPTGDDQLLPMMDYNLLHGRTYLYSKLKPLYPFGFGLSYTTFAYQGIAADTSSISADGSVHLTVNVKNTGMRASDEVVQLYVQHLGSAVPRPILELKGFERVHLQPGQERAVAFTLKARDLAYWDAVGHVWKVEKESIRVLAGGASNDLPVKTLVEVNSAADFKP